MQINTKFPTKKYKAIKELYLGCKLAVHALPGLCTLNILDSEISLISCGKFRKHHREPLFGHGNTVARGLPTEYNLTSRKNYGSVLLNIMSV
jgi:hypothetical protein